MPISEEITALVDRTNQQLNEIHDFFEHTRVIWRSFQDAVDQGLLVTFTNSLTGTTVNQNDLVNLSQEYVTDYLTTLTFQHFVGIFEQFLFDLLRILLFHNPNPLGRKQVEFKTVLAAPDRDTIIFSVIDKELNELKYERLRDWFTYLEKTLAL